MANKECADVVSSAAKSDGQVAAKASDGNPPEWWLKEEKLGNTKVCFLCVGRINQQK